MSHTSIYEFDRFGYSTGRSAVIDEMGGIPVYWSAAPFPEIPDGQYAMFNGETWYLVSQPYIEPLPVEVPLVRPPLMTASPLSPSTPSTSITVL